MASKHKAKKIVIDGITFDSQIEGMHYLALKQQLEFNHISDLELQPRFILIEPFVYKGKKQRKTEYIADFAYMKDGLRIVEDVKSEWTRTLPVYRLKRKLLLSRYPEIEFREV
jgi:hypothetical protein